tara:strand:- start:511 stop:675 length:165 start_codon:yes stop_codon:yes gene_type:complete
MVEVVEELIIMLAQIQVDLVVELEEEVRLTHIMDTIQQLPPQFSQQFLSQPHIH